MKKFFLAVVLTLVSACSTLTTPTQQVQAACASITASVQTLTLYKDKLTADQVQTIENSLDAIYPVCGTGVAPTYDSVKLVALLALEAELSKIILDVK